MVIMKEENDCYHNVLGDAAEGPVECVGRDKVIQALK